MSRTLYAIIFGCGFGGIYNLYKLKQLDLSVKAFDKAPEVGGTWYWNQYPGTTTDTTGEIYRYREGKFGVSKATEETYKTRCLILATGHLHTPHYPEIESFEKFTGPVYHTGDWPEHRDLKGKKVGVIGTGSSGAELMVNIAVDVSHLISFQRSSQHLVPHNNGPISAEEREWVHSNWNDIWETVDNHPIAQNLIFKSTPTMSVSAEEHERTWEEIWNGTNGVAFMYRPLRDITNEEANRELCEFFEKKIAQYISDPDKRKKLMPTELYVKRPVTMPGN